MPTRIDNRRSEPRLRFPEGVTSEIEFRSPAGNTLTRPLIELSLNGASFSLDFRIAGLTAGTDISDATLRVGEIEVGVHIQILHMTRDSTVPYVCGIRIFPVTDLDRNELTALFSRLDSVPV